MSATLVALLACAMLLAPPASAISLTATIYNLAPTRVGMMGGGLITIAGQGFFRQGVEGTTTAFLGTKVCKTIDYYSSDTQIVCETPPFDTPVVGIID